MTFFISGVQEVRLARINAAARDFLGLKPGEYVGFQRHRSNPGLFALVRSTPSLGGTRMNENGTIPVGRVANELGLSYTETTRVPLTPDTEHVVLVGRFPAGMLNGTRRDASSSVVASRSSSPKRRTA